MIAQNNRNGTSVNQEFRHYVPRLLVGSGMPPIAAALVMRKLRDEGMDARIPNMAETARIMRTESANGQPVNGNRRTLDCFAPLHETLHLGTPMTDFVAVADNGGHKKEMHVLDGPARTRTEISRAVKGPMIELLNEVLAGELGGKVKQTAGHGTTLEIEIPPILYVVDTGLFEGMRGVALFPDAETAIEIERRKSHLEIGISTRYHKNFIEAYTALETIRLELGCGEYTLYGAGNKPAAGFAVADNRVHGSKPAFTLRHRLAELLVLESSMPPVCKTEPAGVDIRF